MSVLQRFSASLAYSLLIGSILLAILPASAQARSRGILVSPQRVILEGRNRSAAINLVNPGDRPLQFRIGLIHMDMDPEGRLNRVEAPTQEQKEMEKMLRFSPRRTLLEPGKSQTIRLMARRPAGVPDGEYRMHLSISPIAIPASDQTGGGPHAPGETNLDIDLLIGVTLPVFIRYGTLEADLTTTRLEIIRAGGRSFADLDLLRTGNCSVSANIDLFLSDPKGGEEKKIGQVAGAAVYYPNAMRRVRIPLSLPGDFRFAGRALKAVVRDNEKNKGQILSTRVYTLPSP